VLIAGFLVMNPDAIDIDKPRAFAMKNNVATLMPISITWPQQQLAGNYQRCCSSDPVSFLHMF
jgi:hypothetical protein